MYRRNILMTAFGLSLALSAGAALAQQKSIKDQLVGTWTLVSWEATDAAGKKVAPVEGKDLKGILIFTAGGHFAQVTVADVPKLASRDRTKTTPEEDRAIAHAGLSTYGTWTANDADKSLTFKFERSTFPNQSGTEGKRMITALSADELSYTNPARQAGGTNIFVWRRTK